jgi:hypothetical protein
MRLNVRITEKPNEYRMDFDSYTEAVRFADEHKGKSPEATRIDGQGYTRSGWSGTGTFAKAVELAGKGYPDGRKMIEKFKAQIDGKLIAAHAARQEVFYDVVGTGGWDIGTVLTGQPECALEWQDTHIMENRRQGSGKIIKFIVNNTVSWNVSTEVMARRGAAVGALIDCLEHEDYRVEVESVITTGSGAEYVDIRVPLKRAQDHLQLDQLAFALVNASWLRRIGFVHIACAGPIGAKLASWSYGSPQDLDGEELNADQADLYFPCGYGGDRQWHSEATAIKWIQEQLALFGINLKESEVK